MKELKLFFKAKTLKRIGLLIAINFLIFYGSITGQTYVSFQQSEYTVAEGTYLDICLEVTGDWSFADTVGFYMYIEKVYSSGNHFGTVSKELVFIDDTIKCFTFPVSKDNNINEDKFYRFKLINYEHQEDIIFSPIDEIEVNVRSIPESKSLPPRGLFFSGIANTGEPYNTTALYLSNTVDMEPGTSFSIVNGTFNPGGSGGGTWSGASGNPFSTIYVIYVGEQVMEAGNNFCIFITDINPLDLGAGMSISVNGIDQTQNFIISSGGTPNDIKIGQNNSGTYYLTQGSWYKQKGSYKLMGTVIDGISYGKTRSEMEALGIPADLGGGMSDLGTSSGNIDGSFYGILVCDGLIYVCDITDYLLDPDNWSTYFGDDGQVDLQALCDDLCGYATDCGDNDIEINLDNCVLSLVSEIPCDDPLTYKWEKLNSNDEYEVIDEGAITGGEVPDYQVTENGIYILEIECDGGCSFNSNPVIANNCGDCIATVNITQSDCHLIAELTNCNGEPTYQWYQLIESKWEEITGATEYEYDAVEPGMYQVAVSGCQNCEILYDEYEYSDEATITLKKEEILLSNYEYCWPGKYLLNTQVDGIDLNTQSEFNFPYYWSWVETNDFVDDLNTWLENNGYKGHCYLNSGRIPCFEVRCTDGEFGMVLNLNWDDELVYRNWKKLDDHCNETELLLEASAPCTPISYLWSTGETSETIPYNPNQGYYSVTVTCENGCVYVADYGGSGSSNMYGNFNKHKNNQQINEKIYSEENKSEITNNLTIYPVPTDDWIKVDIDIKESGEYNFEISTLLGANVKTIKQKLKKGRNIFDINTGYLPSGVYLIKVMNHVEYGVVKMVISR